MDDLCRFISGGFIFLAALVVQQASFFAFSTLWIINVISDVASDFARWLANASR